MPNIYPFQGAQTRLVRETSYGVTPGSPQFIRLNGLGITLSPSIETDPFAPPGAMVPTVVLINDDFSAGSVDGRLDYNALGFMFSGLFGAPSITSLGGSPAAYQWQWLWNGRRPSRPVSYTVHYGYAESADVVTGFIFNTLSVSGGRADGFDVSGDGFGKAMTAGAALGGITLERQTLTMTGTPTGGDFTLTFNGETTSTIVYNASASAVQTALEGLPSIEAGDVVTGGGPFPGTPITVDFGGPFSGENVTLLTADDTGLTGGTSPTVTAVETTPGGDTVTDIPPVPAGAVQGNVYLDTTWAGLGSTQLLYAYDMSIDIGERLSRVRPINKSRSSDAVIDVSDQEHTIALTLGRNAVADAQLAKLRAGTMSFVRAEWEGDTISGANTYLLQADAAVIYQEAGESDDTDGAMTREYTGRLAIDPTSGNVIRVTLVNTIPSLAG